MIVKVDILTLPVISSKNSEIYIDIKEIVDNILQKDMNLLFVSDEKNIDLSETKQIPKTIVEEVEWDYEKTNLNMSYTFENYFYSYEQELSKYKVTAASNESDFHKDIFAMPVVPLAYKNWIYNNISNHNGPHTSIRNN